MFYKEIQKLKKSELQELLATTLQQKATLERANASNVSELNDKYSALNKWWSDRYNDLQNDIIDTSQELLETETELVELRASVIKLDDINSEYYNTIKELESDYKDLSSEIELLADSKDEEIDQLKKELEESDNLLAETYTNYENTVMESKIHKREKQEAREIAENYSLSNNQLRNELAEGSTPKNMYIHESNTIFVDSGELHIQADDNKSVVFNCSTLLQDLSIINDIVIKEAKKELSNNIQQIKQLTKDL